jgi:hypothetical protein
MVTNGVISFFRTKVYLKNKVEFLRKEWCIIHPVSVVPIPMNVSTNYFKGARFKTLSKKEYFWPD